MRRLKANTRSASLKTFLFLSEGYATWLHSRFKQGRFRVETLQAKDKLTLAPEDGGLSAIQVPNRKIQAGSKAHP